MASDAYQLDNDDLESLPSASDEYRQEPPLPPPPSPPSEVDRNGMTVLDDFVRLVGFANDLRPRIEGILAMSSDIRFWEECIRDQNAENATSPNPRMRIFSVASGE